MTDIDRFEVAMDGLQSAFNHEVTPFVINAYYRAFQGANMSADDIDLACELAIANLPGYGRVPPALSIIQEFRTHRQRAPIDSLQIGSAPGSAPPVAVSGYTHSEEDIKRWMEADRLLAKANKAKVQASKPAPISRGEKRQAAQERSDEAKIKAEQFGVYLAMGGKIPSLEEAIAMSSGGKPGGEP